MKLQQNSGNNKGFIFSMDAVFALTIVILVITIANIYINRIEFSSISDLQIIKKSNDLLKIMDEFPNNGTKFIVLNNYIDFNINTTLRDIIVAARRQAYPIPAIDIEMKFKATCFNYTKSGLINRNYTYISPHIVPQDRFVAAGQRIFVIPNETNVLSTYYCLGEQRSWAK